MRLPMGLANAITHALAVLTSVLRNSLAITCLNSHYLDLPLLQSHVLHSPLLLLSRSSLPRYVAQLLAASLATASHLAIIACISCSHH